MPDEPNPIEKWYINVPVFAFLGGLFGCGLGVFVLATIFLGGWYGTKISSNQSWSDAAGTTLATAYFLSGPAGAIGWGLGRYFWF